MRQKRADYRGSRDRRDRREDMGEKTVKCRYYAEGKCQKVSFMLPHLYCKNYSC